MMKSGMLIFIGVYHIHMMLNFEEVKIKKLTIISLLKQRFILKINLGLNNKIMDFCSMNKDIMQ